MADFTKKMIEIDAAFTNWIKNTFALVTHNHDTQYEKLDSFVKIAAFGIINSAGAKLAGEGNWEVSAVSAGKYKLYIKDDGYYSVHVTPYSEPGVDVAVSAQAKHTSAGVFQNNVDGNVRTYHNNSNVQFSAWQFIAFKLKDKNSQYASTYTTNAYTISNGEWTSASIRFMQDTALDLEKPKIDVSSQGGAMIFIPEEIRNGTLVYSLASPVNRFPSHFCFNYEGRNVENGDGWTGLRASGGSSQVMPSGSMEITSDANRAWVGLWANEGNSWQVLVDFKIVCNNGEQFKFVVANGLNDYRSCGYDSWTYGQIVNAGYWKYVGK